MIPSHTNVSDHMFVQPITIMLNTIKWLVKLLLIGLHHLFLYLFYPYYISCDSIKKSFHSLLEYGFTTCCFIFILKDIITTFVNINNKHSFLSKLSVTNINIHDIKSNSEISKAATIGQLNSVVQYIYQIKWELLMNASYKNRQSTKTACF